MARLTVPEKARSISALCPHASSTIDQNQRLCCAGLNTAEAYLTDNGAGAWRIGHGRATKNAAQPDAQGGKNSPEAAFVRRRLHDPQSDRTRCAPARAEPCRDSGKF